MDISTIHAKIKERFLYYSNNQITDNSVMDLYSLAISDVMNELYEEIEAAKMPHLYTKLADQSLDDLGFLLATPREIDETDTQYLYRLMNWKYSAEASNRRAIETALLNRTYASYAEYIPMTNGSGTGTVYIIPLTYNDKDVVMNAVTECIDVMERVSSEGLYVEYVIPEPKPVVLHIGITFSPEGDPESIKRTIGEAIGFYVNNVPPNKYLLVGMINTIGTLHDYVTYFSTLQIFINDQEMDGTEIFQRLEEKFLLKEIVWTEE